MSAAFDDKVQSGWAGVKHRAEDRPEGEAPLKRHKADAAGAPKTAKTRGSGRKPLSEGQSRLLQLIEALEAAAPAAPAAPEPQNVQAPAAGESKAAAAAEVVDTLVGKMVQLTFQAYGATRNAIVRFGSSADEPVGVFFVCADAEAIAQHATENNVCEENRKNAATVFTHMGRIAFGGWAVGLMRPRRGGRPCWQTVKCTDAEGLRARIGDIQRQLSKSPEDVVLARGSFDFAGCEEQCHLLVRGDAGATAKGVRYIRFVEGRRLTAGELAFAVRTMHTALGL